MSEAALEQRRNNSAQIAERRRNVEVCMRGHNNWYIRPDGRRMCRTCNNDRNYYLRHGLSYL